MIPGEVGSAVNELPRELQTLKCEHFKFEYRKESVVRTIIAKTNSCMRAITALNPRSGIEIRRATVHITRFVVFLERARYGRYLGLLRTGPDATELYLKVLCNEYKGGQGGQHSGSERRKPQCISA